MKKVNRTNKLQSILCFISLSLLGAFSVNAQSSIGGQFGITHTTFNLDGQEKVESRENALIAGVFANFEFAEWFSLQPELSYTKLGGSVTSELTGEFRKYRIEYLNIPVIAKFAVPIKGKYFPFIGLGPYGSLKLAADYKYENPETMQVVDLSDRVANFDYGALLTAGFDVRLEDVFIGIDGRYGLPFNSIETSTEDPTELKSGLLSATIRVGYRFGGE